MRIVNYAIFLLPFIVSFIIALLVSAPGLVFILSYFVILGMFISAFVLTDFLILYRRSKKPIKYCIPKVLPNLRIAVLTTTFNEDPKLLQDTILSAKLAVGKKGDVFVLDDSTDEEAKRQLDNFKDFGFMIQRRSSRRGYKAGAVNDWLSVYGDKYDLMAIFDADQRPMPFIFDNVSVYFDDEKTAFVQVPQYYSDISSGVSLGAFFQQLPFLRLIMNGRNRANSAFSLGSGTIYKIKSLQEIGGLDESTITEDISTALTLHSKGLKSVYIDKPLIWYGMPPNNIRGYWVQQGRWSLGGFQLLPNMLSSRLNSSQFFDYYNGWLYWLNVGPITLFQLIAPMVFLLLGVAFLNWNPLAYLAVYIPYFLSSLCIYSFITRKHNYGLRGFIYHHTVQLLAFISVTSSFVAWLTRKRRPFAVTPKVEDQKTPLKIMFSFSAVTVILALSAIKGTYEVLTGQAASLAAYAINIFWALYFTAFFIFGLYIIMRRKPYSEELKLSIKPSYLAVNQKHTLISLAYESVIFEEKIAELYGLISQKLSGETAATLGLLSKESAGHAKMLKQVLSWLNSAESPQKDKAFSVTAFVDSIEKFIPLLDQGLGKENTLVLLQLLLETEKEFSEEIYMGLLTKIFTETLLRKTGKYREIKGVLQKIRTDELRHAELIEGLRDKHLRMHYNLTFDYQFLVSNVPELK